MEARDINRREILRYLGARSGQRDEAVERLVEDCIGELFAQTRPRHIVRQFPLTLGADGEIDGGCFRTRSRNLYKNLRDCGQILVFAATLGTGADQLIRRYSLLEMSRAVVLQAVSAAMIEVYCDQVCGQLREEYEGQGWFLRPRFSPGYGDFPLACQTALLDGLEAGKRIGIKLTDSLLMMPSKSVTAVMGLSRRPGRCLVSGCETCSKTDCAYRRQTAGSDAGMEERK